MSFEDLAVHSKLEARLDSVVYLAFESWSTQEKGHFWTLYPYFQRVVGNVWEGIPCMKAPREQEALKGLCVKIWKWSLSCIEDLRVLEMPLRYMPRRASGREQNQPQDEMFATHRKMTPSKPFDIGFGDIRSLLGSSQTWLWFSLFWLCLPFFPFGVVMYILSISYIMNTCNLHFDFMGN